MPNRYDSGRAKASLLVRSRVVPDTGIEDYEIHGGDYPAL